MFVLGFSPFPVGLQHVLHQSPHFQGSKFLVPRLSSWSTMDYGPKSSCSLCSKIFKIVANIVWWTRLSSYKHVLRFLNRIEAKNMHIFSLFVAWNKPQYIQHNLIKSSIKYFVIFDVNIIFELKCSFLNFKILKNSWFQYNTYTYTHHLLHKEKLVFPVACYFVAKAQFLCSYPKLI